MSAALMVAACVAAMTLALTTGAKNACPCHSDRRNAKDVICDSTSARTITAIDNCVSKNTTVLSIRTPSILLVPKTIRQFKELTRINVEFFGNPQITKNFLSDQEDLTCFQIYKTGLEFVDGRWFMHSPNIRTLILAYNKIASLSSDTFSYLPKLTTLSLNGNQLRTLPPNIFDGTSLKKLHIRHNPWQCTCELAHAMDWAREHGVEVPDTCFCNYPVHLQGLDVSRLMKDEACRP